MSTRWKLPLLQKSVALKLTNGLTATGWMPPPTFLTAPVTIVEDFDTELVHAGQAAPPPNTIGISTGDVPDSKPLELGGGLLAYEVPVFLDIYGENRSVSLRLSDDIREILLGELYDLSRFIPLYDFSQDPLVAIEGDLCEARLVEARWPTAAGTAEWRRAWRVVAFTASYTFVGLAADAPPP